MVRSPLGTVMSRRSRAPAVKEPRFELSGEIRVHANATPVVSSPIMDWPQQSPLFRTKHGRLAMTPLPLAPDDLLRCPHCHRWHPLVLRNVVKSTSYAKTCCSGNAARAVASTMPVNSVSPVDSKHADREIYRVGYHGPMPRKRERSCRLSGTSCEHHFRRPRDQFIPTSTSR